MDAFWRGDLGVAGGPGGAGPSIRWRGEFRPSPFLLIHCVKAIFRFGIFLARAPRAAERRIDSAGVSCHVPGIPTKLPWSRYARLD